MTSTPLSRTRDTCRSCDSSALLPVLDLGHQPLSDRLRKPEELSSAEARYPLELVFCEDCSLVQIRETVVPEELFNEEYPYFSSFSDALLEHSRKNVEAQIDARGLSKDHLVVEIASNDGYLLQYYKDRGIPVLGIDPSGGPAAAAMQRGIPTRVEFFTPSLARALREEGLRADVIHANNVLAHVADIHGFLSGIRHLLNDGGVAIFEVPYVRDLIEHCEFDTIYHEHLCYFSVSSLVRLFASHGLALRNVEKIDLHGGSLRVFVEPGRKAGKVTEVWLREETDCGLTSHPFYRQFSERVKWVRSELRELLRGLKAKGHSIAAYGAAAKGAILLNYSHIGSNVLSWVADRNVHKQGLYMPGVDLRIVPPSRLLEERPDYVLILPWNFKDEIMQQQAEYVQRGGRFIVPIPTPRVV